MLLLRFAIYFSGTVVSMCSYVGAADPITSLEETFAKRIIHTYGTSLSEIRTNFKNGRSLSTITSSPNEDFLFDSSKPSLQSSEFLDKNRRRFQGQFLVPAGSQRMQLVRSPQNDEENNEENDQDFLLAENRTTSKTKTIEKQDSCDTTFVSCLLNDSCGDCFEQLEVMNVDWPLNKPDTCDDVLNILEKKKICKSLISKRKNEQDRSLFCKSFEACVSWQSPQTLSDDGVVDDYEDDKIIQEESIDCDSLTECKWEGFRLGYIGDGLCHDGIGCYNHKICDYDGGDCCPDTCKNQEKKRGTSGYFDCGDNEYICRDPSSKKCNPDYSDDCPHAKGGDDGSQDNYNKNIIPVAKCQEGETPYILTQYDAWGDGWDSTEMMITRKGEKTPIYQGKLEDGSEGKVALCLSSNESTCYSVKVWGGIWGKEVSWDIRSFSQSPLLASGGTPTYCDFPVAGMACDKTCNGAEPTNEEITKDKNYKTYKLMTTCIKEKCIIQYEVCKNDRTCQPCMTESAPPYCYGNDRYLSLITCTLCNCMDDNDEDDDDMGDNNPYCEQKDLPSKNDDEAAKKKSNYRKTCNSNEIISGTIAVRLFQQCSQFDAMYTMITEFDNDNFGPLDAFEACATTFIKEDFHGGKSALDCMRILSRAAEDPTAGNFDHDENTPLDAIKALAYNLYHDGVDFCKCSAGATKESPNCLSFTNFNTLMYETMDACRALDDIDCDAWSEFSTPCQKAMISRFGKIDFSKKDHCEYIQNSCPGPFPSFRKFDCDGEIDSDHWNFFQSYSKGCLESGVFPTPSVPTPKKSGDNPGTNQPTPYEPAPPDVIPSSSANTNYVPREKRARKRIQRFFLHLFIIGLICACGYFYYKRTSGFRHPFDWDFKLGSFRNRFSRVPQYNPDNEDGGMYMGLNMESMGGSSFEPTSLPPPPSAYENPQNSYRNPNYA